MKLGLLIVRLNELKHYSVRRQVRFAVVNLDYPGGYPANFVCMLPLHIDPIGKPSKFTRILGDKSLEMAKMLLNGALKTEQDAEVKSEIKRRLDLLEPLKFQQVKCLGCAKLFQSRRIGKYSQNFCEDCRKKRYWTVA